MTRLRAGLTLSELVVAMGVMVLVGGIIVASYLSTSRFAADEQNRLEVDVGASRVLQVLDATLRQGKAVLATATISGTLYTSTGTTLVFTLPALLADGTTSLTAVDTAVLRQSGGELQLLLAPDTSSTRSSGTRPLLMDVKDVYIRYADPAPANATAVSVTVRTERSIRGTPYTRSSILYALFRNRV